MAAKRYNLSDPRQQQEKRLADWLESIRFPLDIGVFEQLSRLEAEYLAEALLQSGFVIPRA